MMKLKKALEILTTNESAEEELAIEFINKQTNLKLIQLLSFLGAIFILGLLFTVLGFGLFTDLKYKLLIIAASGIFTLITAYYLPMKEEYQDKNMVFNRYKRIDLIHFFIICSFTVFVLLAFVVRTAVVEGSSMEDTLFGGDKIVAYHLNYQPKRNDVVIVDMKEHNFEQIYYVKRLIGLPGDKIYFDRLYGKLYVNDILVQEVPTEYREALANTLSTLENNIIPKDAYFILGDNINTSLDSRRIGFVDKDQLVGKVLLRFSPKLEVIS